MMAQNAIPKEIVILGGGTAGWMAASLLHQAWKERGIRITLIESEEISIVGVGEGSTPSLQSFFRRLNIPESEWMPECNATYKCGISFPKWSTKPGFEHYHHPFFSQIDLKTGPALVRNTYVRRCGGDVPAHPDNFFVSTELMKQKRSPKTQNSQPLDLDYGYHFDSVLLGKFLKKRAIKLGVRHVIDTVGDVIQDSDGNIRTLHTQNNGEIKGDYFIDCSGFASVLIGKTLNVPFIDYQDYLFNDRAIAIPAKIDNTKPIESETESCALSNGWAWKIPLANRYGYGYVYSSEHISNEDAEAELREYIGPGCKGMKARQLKWRVGFREKAWHKNVLAVGLSLGFIEPLEATALLQIQYNIDQFIAHFEAASTSSAGIEEHKNMFNKKINAVIDGIKNYLVAHYRLNTRTDTDYWIANRDNTNISDSLKDILVSWDQGLDFEATLTKHNAEMVYLRPSWYCILAGMGRFPESLHTPSAETNIAPADKAQAYCEKMAENFMDHRENLINTYGSAWPK